MSGALRFSRRHFLRGVAAATAVPLLAACGAGSTDPSAPDDQPTADATEAMGGTPPVISSSGKMSYWGGLIFSDEANQMLEETIIEWGQQHGIEIEVTMINQNETNQRVSAAVEAGTMPDALDMGLDLLLLLSAEDQLEALDDLYEKIGSQGGGWLEAADAATNPDMLGGARTGIPFGLSGNLLYSRQDVLQQAGLTPPPKTWQEIRNWSEQAQEPPLYGMGFALSNVGDGNLQASVLQSFGGRIADDNGKTCTIKSPETRTYLEWVSEAHAAGLFPPGVATWDGAGDNNVYQAGQAIFIANPGSVYLWMKDNDPDLLEVTHFAALPSGPIGTISPITPNVRAIPKGGKNVDAAKALIEHLARPEFLTEYYKVAIYGPVLSGLLESEAFEDPVHAGLADLAQNGTAPGYPDVYNTAYAEFSNNFIVPKMIQRIVVDGWDIDQAMDEAQQQGEAIYAKHR